MKIPSPETTTVHMSPELLAEARKAAIEEHRPADELVSDAVRRYLQQRKQTSRENLFVERQPEAQRASDVQPTQAEAIDRARQLQPGVTPLAERVRHTSESKPDLAQLLMDSPFAGANLDLERRKDYTRSEL